MLLFGDYVLLNMMLKSINFRSVLILSFLINPYSNYEIAGGIKKRSR